MQDQSTLPEERTCAHCGERFIAPSAKMIKRFCSQRCRNLSYFPQRATQVDRHMAGVLNELAVVRDLAERGYEVFRPVSTKASCDIIALREGRVVRVEVRHGFLRRDGTVSYVRKRDGRAYDVFVAVVGSTLHYIPAEAV